MTAPPQATEPALYRLHVFCCTHVRPPTHWRGSCSDRGSRVLCNYMARLGMVRGLPRVRINQAGCMNVCEHGPVMVVYPDGIWYRYETEADVEEIMRSHLIGGVPVARLRLLIDPATLHG